MLTHILCNEGLVDNVQLSFYTEDQQVSAPCRKNNNSKIDKLQQLIKKEEERNGIRTD